MNVSATHTGVVDAWYARNGQHPATAKESTTTTARSVDFVANGLRVTANGTASSGIVVSLLGRRAIVAGGITTPNADQLAEGGANGFDVVQGHLYRLRLTLVSGTRTDGDPAFIALYDTTGAAITGTGCSENTEKYITMDRSNIGQVCMFLKKNTVFTNAVYTMEIVDVTSIGELDGDSVPVSGATPTITALSGGRYICGTVTELTFTPSASGICSVRFVAGSSMVLTLPNTVKMPDWWSASSIVQGRTYEISIADGVHGVVTPWA